MFIGDITLPQLLALPIEEALATITSWTLSPTQQNIAERLLWEIETRLQCLLDLGLGYLTLMRSSPTLSGGRPAHRTQLLRGKHPRGKHLRSG